MHTVKVHLEESRQRMERLIAHVLETEHKLKPLIEEVHPQYHKSALNLLHYIALRHQDIEPLQNHLGMIGISSLQNAEAHVMANLLKVQKILNFLAEQKENPAIEPPVSIEEGTSLREQNRKSMFGERPKKRSAYIMVTMPDEAEKDYGLVKDMISRGMSCARINCAKGGPEQWQRMADNIRQASRELEQECKVLMDLGGPKIRTSDIIKGSGVLKIKPQRDIEGITTRPAPVRLAPQYQPTQHGVVTIPVALSLLEQLQKDDILITYDTRGHERTIKIKEVGEKEAKGSMDQISYLEPHGRLLLQRKGEQVAEAKIQDMPGKQLYIFLQKGDLLYLHEDDQVGEPARTDEKGHVTKAAHVGCTLPQIFEDVAVGQPVMFDDGKIKGKVTDKKDGQLEIRISYAKNGRRALKPEKGINFPESQLSISGLTEKDIEDLEVVGQIADIINLSFVRTPQDVLDFLKALEEKQVKESVGIMLKIETRQSVENLPWLLLHAMRRYPVGVMLARGDLAIEIGWEDMSYLQNEILWLCQAGHIPMVWATQVLEGAAKKGLPKRAEITDAAIAHNADCVMLNKGRYIHNTIEMLSTILRKMEKQKKKSSNLVQQLSFEEALSRQDR